MIIKSNCTFCKRALHILMLMHNKLLFCIKIITDYRVNQNIYSCDKIRRRNTECHIYVVEILSLLN